jgi:hypothetical protein
MDRLHRAPAQHARRVDDRIGIGDERRPVRLVEGQRQIPRHDGSLWKGRIESGGRTHDRRHSMALRQQVGEDVPADKTARAQ